MTLCRLVESTKQRASRPCDKETESGVSFSRMLSAHPPSDQHALSERHGGHLEILI